MVAQHDPKHPDQSRSTGSVNAVPVLNEDQRHRLNVILERLINGKETARD